MPGLGNVKAKNHEGYGSLICSDQRDIEHEAARTGLDLLKQCVTSDNEYVRAGQVPVEDGPDEIASPEIDN